MDRPVGGVHNKNYLSFRMMYKGVSYNILNHRAVFFLTHGYWPYGVDHKDGNGFNNTPDNLRECDQKDNNGNCAPKHGRQYKGITYVKIGVHGKHKELKVKLVLSQVTTLVKRKLR